MTKVLLCGGAGYIGSHTAVELLTSGFDVVVVDDLSNSSEKSLERVREITGKDFPFYDRSGRAGGRRDRELADV